MPLGGRSLTLLGANALFLALALALLLRADLALLLLPLFSLVFMWADFRKDEEMYVIFLFLTTAAALVLVARAPGGAQRAALAVEWAGVVGVCLGLGAHRSRMSAGRRRFEAAARAHEARLLDLEREERFYRDFEGTASAQVTFRRDLTAAAKSLGTTLEPEEVQRRLLGVVEKRFPGARVHVLPGAPQDPLVEWAARTRSSVLVRDSASDERLRGKAVGWRSAVMAPLTVLKQPYGYLRLEDARPSAFGQEDVRTVDVFATLASLALENIQLFQRVNDLATHDGLTQLATHRAFQDRLQEEVLRAGRSQTPLSLLLLDLDHFKRYNDSFGHQAGDLLLKTAAGILTNHVRPVDFVARYGGEEFAVLLPGTVHSQAVELGSRIRLRVAEEDFLFQGQRTRVTVSIGVSSFPQDAATTSQLVRVADERLYRAKQNGRNQVVG